MEKFLSFEEIQHKCEQLNEVYQIDGEKFYQVVENWAERNTSTEEKMVNSFKELLQVVSDEIGRMEEKVEMKPTCQMGCAFCCYFPIIVNGMEAKLMKKAIEDFPEERRKGIQSHLKQYFERYGEQLNEITAYDFEEDPDFKKKYILNQVPCPMLNTETNQCMAYEIRPIPCRTYVNYTDPKVCETNVMPEETISFEFLYSEYMGALNEFVQYLYEEGDTAFVEYPDDVFAYDYLPNWLKSWVDQKPAQLK
ncbi:YkgJ family cysteine cluster protein [Salinibacillus xinjiangensis]|uniref:YkgJ family cysteine cluster protein n=1 Tax=Salinibacillus xinjiangensis TaxID=1229268 RepID=A0A6G1X8Y9_9BACI|nr:YkgJ family cysteine cluster protein [Salinibacillus xinjiangensis]MRG87434.1 YkgJ family cysteine cluster protein [Salinibacillus xinjiangensis]